MNGSQIPLTTNPFLCTETLLQELCTMLLGSLVGEKEKEV